MSVGHRAVLALLLALVTLAVFLPALANGFLTFDDHLYITDNAMVRQGLHADTARWALTARTAGHWQPVTLWSHLLDVRLFGLDPRGHHLTSVVLHAVNAGLLFWLFAALTAAPWRALALAALWAIHPLRVESVVWAAERKDVLCATFFLLALIAYTRWAKSGSRGAYVAALGLFALGLMAKAMLVTLPCVLLLVDLWPLDRLRLWDLPRRDAVRLAVRRLVEKLPFFALSAVSSAVTLAVQWQFHAPERHFPFWARAANACLAYAQYLRLLVWPRNLAVLYPLPAHLPWAAFGLAVVVLVAVSVLAWKARRRAPYVLVGWCWYLGMLVPVNGVLDQGGAQSLADRYSYLPSIGLVAAAVWAIADWARTAPRRRAAVAGLCVLALAGSAAATRRQIAFWHDDRTLWQRAVDVTGPNYVGEINLAAALVKAGDVRNGAVHYAAAARIAPESAEAWGGFGEALRAAGRPREAVASLRQAVALAPNDPRVHASLAHALLDAGDPPGALAELRVAVGLAPEDRDLAGLLARLESGEPR